MTTHAMIENLITFGCSWTYGVGVTFIKSQTESEYGANAWNPKFSDGYSFRGQLSKKLNWKNINFFNQRRRGSILSHGIENVFERPSRAFVAIWQRYAIWQPFSLLQKSAATC